MMIKKPEHLALDARFGADEERLCSALSAWETARELASIRTVPIGAAQAEIARCVHDFAMRLVPTGAAEAQSAIAAHHRYGKSRHPARLNMGDCFAYVRTQVNGAAPLYKGDKVARTDLA